MVRTRGGEAPARARGERAEAALSQTAKIAQGSAKTLEILGDIYDADAAPPENVLFVCKLNKVTDSESLELIFSRFGNIGRATWSVIQRLVLLCSTHSSSLTARTAAKRLT